MCTTEQTFAWVGTIVVNIAFISIIAWGATEIWWVGFLLSVAYTAMLFGLARVVDKRSGWDDNDDNNVGATAADADVAVVVETSSSDEGSIIHHDETENVVASVDRSSSHNMNRRRRTATKDSQRMPVLANLLYGLFSLALGVTGYFLPMNIFNCYGYGGPYTPSSTSSGHWTTDISTLPIDVRAWATSSSSQLSPATFVYIPGEEDGQNNATLFLGSDASDNHPQTLWSTKGAEPINFPSIQNPSQFITTGTGWACFAGIDASPFANNNEQYYQPMPISKSSLIGCSNGEEVWTTKDSTQYSFQGPYDFLIDNHTLWYKDYPPWSGDQTGTGTLIYSINDYTKMDVELHSTYKRSTQYKPKGGDNTTNNPSHCWVNQSVLAIFVSSIPTLMVSILLWCKRNAPSMALTSYIGLSATACFTYMAIVGNAYDMNDFWGWWLSISGALYMIIMSDLLHCNRRIARSPLIWGINLAALAFFIGMIFLTGIYELNMAWTWIVFNLFALIPLAIVGIGYNQVFLLVLCAVGWLMTAIEVAEAIAAITASTANVPIYFIVLAISGLLIAAAGWWLNRNQDELQSVICYHMEGISLSRRLLLEGESEPEEETPARTREQGVDNLNGGMSAEPIVQP
jgi:membrane protein implicated in regulation of membrane protease activity